MYVPIPAIVEKVLHLSHKYTTVIVALCVFLLLLILFLFWVNAPPSDFGAQRSLEVMPGDSLKEVSSQLKREGYIRSADLFYFASIIMRGESHIKAGWYEFDTPIGTIALAKKLINETPSDTLVSLTVPEGVNAVVIAELADEKLEIFDKSTFITLAEEHEGYLFPDTYFVPLGYSEADLLDLLLETYETKISPLRPLIASSTLSEYETLIFASILEREANTVTSMRMVSGILHNRLRIGMPLQVDAVFEYVYDKSPALLTKSDLQLESPYNTYLNTGLPPTPIGNPGLTAIEATLDPIDNDYIFYITGNDGNFYYAKTLSEHNANVARYLR